MAAQCTAADLAYLLGMLNGLLVQPEECPKPRERRVLVTHDSDGLHTELLAEVCTEHEIVLSATEEYQRSWPLRSAGARTVNQ